MGFVISHVSTFICTVVSEEFSYNLKQQEKERYLIVVMTTEEGSQL